MGGVARGSAIPTQISNGDIAAAAGISLSKLANIPDLSLLGNNTGGAGPPIALTAAQARAILQTPAAAPVGPDVNGLLGVNIDPEAATSTATPAGATIYLAKFMIPYDKTITSIGLVESTGSTVYTNAQTACWSSAGVLLSASAVQAGGGAHGFNFTGDAFVPLAVPQLVTGAPGAFVFLGVHFGTNPATAAIFRCGTSTASAINFGTTASTLRFGTLAGHATSDLATQDHGLGANGNFTPSGMAAAANPFLIGFK